MINYLIMTNLKMIKKYLHKKTNIEIDFISTNGIKKRQCCPYLESVI